MKLLGRMHRKLRQNYNEPRKNFTIGNPATCFSGQVFLNEQKYYVETADTYASEPFTFLAIGTFGSELMDTDSPTPTFPLPFENVTANEQTETRENDPKLINYELEKFLEVEAEEIENDSSQRSSLASIITICNEGIEGVDSEAYADTVASALQNSLFASSIHELGWMRVEPDKEKASFEEHFKKNMILVDDPKGKREGPEKRAKGNYVKHFIKKMMKKLHSTSKSSIVSCIGDATKSTSITNGLPKLKGLKLFHKKVHPAGLITEKQFKLQKDDMAENISHEHEDDHQIGKENGTKANIKQYEQNAMKLSSNGIRKGASMVNSEYWIRTDAEYLVLEL